MTDPDRIMQHITLGMVDDDAFEREVAFAVKSQSHLWVSVVTFKVSDTSLDNIATEPILMDRENMLSMPMVGCLVCEQPYTSALRKRRCTGEPSGI